MIFFAATQLPTSSRAAAFASGFGPGLFLFLSASVLPHSLYASLLGRDRERVRWNSRTNSLGSGWVGLVTWSAVGKPVGRSLG